MRVPQLAGATLALTMYFAGPGLASAAEDIKIGVFLSETGVMSPMGGPERAALDMMAEKINAEGGALGRKISLISYDDASEPEKARTFVKRLIEQDNVDLIIGGSGTPTSLAVINLIERAEIPYISLGGGNAIVEPVRKWVFKIPPSDKVAADRILEELKARGLTRLAMLSESGGYGKSGHDQTLALAPKYGIEIIADETYSPKDPDVKAQLTRIRSNPAVQALFVFGTGSGPVVATKAIKEMGLSLPLYQSPGVGSRDFLKLVGNAADGMRLPLGALPLAGQLPAGDPQKPVVQAFKQMYEDRAKQEVSTLAGNGWDSLMMGVEAIKRAGGTDRAKVREEIEKTRNFVANCGTFTMSPDNHSGLDGRAYHMVEVRNGGWVISDTKFTTGK